MERKKHWNKIYQEKNPQQVSWTEAIPEISLQLIEESQLPESAAIIDVGGGESKLVDFLLGEGYENLTVLDIPKASGAGYYIGTSFRAGLWRLFVKLCGRIDRAAHSCT